MVTGEIIVDREQALSAVESYDSETQELKAINDLITAASSALEGAWGAGGCQRNGNARRGIVLYGLRSGFPAQA